MLFALDWIENVWDAMAAGLLSLARPVTIPWLASAMTRHWLILAGCLLAGLLLCFYGFRYHKLILGLAGSVFFGTLGWKLGCSISEEILSISIVYTMFFVIGGFFLSYLLYFAVVFAGSWFLFLGILSLFPEGLGDRRLWLALLPAALYGFLYTRYKLVMSGVSGGLVLGLLVFSLSPAAAAAVLCLCVPGGIWVQCILRKRYQERKERERQEEIEKYPYGRGWPTAGPIQKSRGNNKFYKTKNL